MEQGYKVILTKDEMSKCRAWLNRHKPLLSKSNNSIYFTDAKDSRNYNYYCYRLFKQYHTEKAKTFNYEFTDVDYHNALIGYYAKHNKGVI